MKSSKNQPGSDRQRRPLRNVLLGATAAIVLGGSIGTGLLTPPAGALAQSQTQSQDQSHQSQARDVTIPGSVPSFAPVIARVKSAVVSVRVRTTEEGDETARTRIPGFPNLQPGDPLERFFRRFGEEGGSGARPGRPRQRVAQGSGFVISSDGYVVTNNHVVKNADEVVIGLDDGRSVGAKVVGTDEKTDLALLKITEPGKYTYAEWADGSPRIGDWVLAVGNPFGLGGTVTAGIVSARGRDIGSGPYDDFLQIDAPVNRGNSGGPTFDLNGRVVGVNTAIYSPSGGSVGIGFAIPSTVARDVISALRENGKVSRGYIGVQIQAITPELAESMNLRDNKGALIAETQKGTPGEKAGLQSGDVIVAVNGDAIETPRELSRKIAALGPRKTVELTYRRDGRERTVSVTLQQLPDETADARSGGADNDRNDDEPRLGLRLAPGDDGVEVAEVEPGSPASRRGVRQGDVIVEVAGKPVSKPSEVAQAVREARKSDKKMILMRVRTGQSTRFLALPTKADS